MPIRISDLPREVIAKIEGRLYDQIINKHEGPERWGSLDDHEFIQTGDYDVLLPIDKEHLQNVTILRCIVSDDSTSLTLFLKDTTYDGDRIFAGRVAVCDKLDAEDFFIAILYHEWFIIDYQTGRLASEW